MRILAILVVLLWPAAALAQDDEGGRLTRIIENAFSATGWDVQITGLSGALSSTATIERLTVDDGEGVFLTVEDIVLDWRRAALLRRNLVVNELTASRIEMTRRPTGGEAEPRRTGGGFEVPDFSLPELPLSVDIGLIEAEEVVLAEAVLGQAVTASLVAEARLADGDGNLRLQAERIDGTEGRLALTGAFSNDTRVLTFDVELVEDAGGLAASAMNLPGAPSVDLDAQGDGPLSDFAADLRLATDGQDRLTGTVTMAQDTEDETSPLVFTGDVSGDLSALFAPDYREFFGTEIVLDVDGALQRDGTLDLSRLLFSAQSMTLGGRLSLNPERWPTFIELDGRIAAPDGEPVRLPIPGEPTDLAGMTLDLRFDAAQDEAWTLRAALSDLDRPDLDIGIAQIAGGGTIAPGTETTLGRVTGELEILADGIAPADPAVAEAVGASILGDLDFSYEEDGRLVFDRFELAGAGYSASGNLALSGLGAGFEATGAAEVRVGDLTRFAALADRPLGGSVALDAEGTVTPLSGAFDLRATGTATDVTVGIDGADALLAGTNRVIFDGRRDAEGLVVDAFSVDGPQVTADATARISSDGGSAQVSARLTDTALLVPGLAGAVELTADATSDGGPWAIDADLAGIDYGVQVDGTLDPADDFTFDGTARATSADLSRFRALAGRPLGGAVEARFAGQAALATAAFDGRLDATATDLRIGQAQADRLLAGRTVLRVDAAREGDELILRRFDLNGANLTASGSGELRPPSGRFTYDATLRNIGIFVPELSGPVRAQGTASTQGGPWQIDARIDGPAGSATTVRGTVATDPSLTLGLSISGSAPLQLANPFITPRNLSGTAQYTLSVNGPPALSSVSGQITVADARLSAPVLQVAITGIDATVTLSGGQAQIALEGGPEAGGRGTLNGTVSLAAPFQASLEAVFTNVALERRNLFSSTLNGSLTLNGPLAGNARVGGALTLGTTEIRIPTGSLTGTASIPDVEHVQPSPPTVTTLERAGLIGGDGSGQGTGGGGPAYLLDITLSAPTQVFVRGRGIDAELGGRMRITGTTRSIVPIGRFDLIRGRLELLGQRYDLTRGSVQLAGDFDPILLLVAETRAQNITATIIVAGPASNPEVTFSSVPELPPDEILAQVLFGKPVAELSTFDLLRLAAEVGELTGGGSGVAGRLREGIGVDDLDITTADDGSTNVRVGKYLTENLYTDVTVNSEGGSEINLNLDVTRSLTVRGSVADTGESGIGIYFERDY